MGGGGIFRASSHDNRRRPKPLRGVSTRAPSHHCRDLGGSILTFCGGAASFVGDGNEMPVSPEVELAAPIDAFGDVDTPSMTEILSAPPRPTHTRGVFDDCDGHRQPRMEWKQSKNPAIIENMLIQSEVRVCRKTSVTLSGWIPKHAHAKYVFFVFPPSTPLQKKASHFGTFMKVDEDLGIENNQLSQDVDLNHVLCFS